MLVADPCTPINKLLDPDIQWVAKITPLGEYSKSESYLYLLKSHDLTEIGAFKNVRIKFKSLDTKAKITFDVETKKLNETFNLLFNKWEKFLIEHRASFIKMDITFLGFNREKKEFEDFIGIKNE